MTLFVWRVSSEAQYSKAPSIDDKLSVAWWGLQSLWHTIIIQEHFEMRWTVRVWQCFNQSKAYWTSSWIWIGVNLKLFRACCQSPIHSDCQSTQRHLIPFLMINLADMWVMMNSSELDVRSKMFQAYRTINIMLSIPSSKETILSWRFYMKNPLAENCLPTSSCSILDHTTGCLGLGLLNFVPTIQTKFR